jgi:hypothetical protein
LRCFGYDACVGIIEAANYVLAGNNLGKVGKGDNPNFSPGCYLDVTKADDLKKFHWGLFR